MNVYETNVTIVLKKLNEVEYEQRVFQQFIMI